MSNTNHFEMEKAPFDELVELARASGYDVSNLIITPQRKAFPSDSETGGDDGVADADAGVSTNEGTNPAMQGGK